LQRAHLPARLGLLWVDLPTLLGQLVGLLAGTAPGLNLLGLEAARLVEVLAHLGGFLRCGAASGGELVGGAPAHRPARLRAAYGLCRGWLGASSGVAAAASPVSERLCGGSILRSTVSLRSSEYLGTVLSSSPPVAVTVLQGGGDN
jgi:hypothetical protein